MPETSAPFTTPAVNGTDSASCMLLSDACDARAFERTARYIPK